MMVTAKTVPENEFIDRKSRSGLVRSSQNERMELGLRGAPLDHLALGKVRCVPLFMPSAILAHVF